MIKIGMLDEYICMYLDNYNYNTINRYLCILNLLKNEEYIPKFYYIKFNKLIIIKNKCVILDSLSNNDILTIRSILESINTNKIKINYLEKFKFFKDVNNNKIYFINFLWASSTITYQLNLEKDLNYFESSSSYTNYYIINKFIKKNYNKNLNIIENINLYIYIYFDYNENIIENINYFINNLIYLTYNIKYIFILDNQLYKKFIINKEILDKIHIIIVKYISNYHLMIIKLFKKFNLKKDDFIIIQHFNEYSFSIKLFYDNIYNIYSKNLNNFILSDSKIYNLNYQYIKYFSENYNYIHEKIKKNNKSINDYTTNDINFNDIIVNDNLLTKKTFLTYYYNNTNNININYNFIDKITPKNIKIRNIIFDYFSFNIIKHNIIHIKNYNFDYNNFITFLSLIIFYNNINYITY